MPPSATEPSGRSLAEHAKACTTCAVLRKWQKDCTISNQLTERQGKVRHVFLCSCMSFYVSMYDTKPTAPSGDQASKEWIPTNIIMHESFCRHPMQTQWTCLAQFDSMEGLHALLQICSSQDFQLGHVTDCVTFLALFLSAVTAG